MSRKLKKILSLITTATMTCVFAMPALSVFSEERTGVLQKEMASPIEIGLVESTWTVTPESNAEVLVQNLLGDDITLVGTPTLIGAAGTFTNTNNAIGFDSGLILSSGFVTGVPGPNNNTAYTGENGLPGDADLNTLIPGYYSYDATILEFYFQLPANIGISSFQYVFASEEYNEWVGSAFNDVFGFFLDGQNIALIPNSTTPVSINNVNNGSFPSYYRDNTGNTIDTQMDGLTTVLTAIVNVTDQEIHHIKLAIADAGDDVLDSNVFLKTDSFTQNTPPEIACDNTNISVNEGDQATNTGTWSDLDGNEVAITASVGEISKTNGTWSWSYLTADGPSPDTQAVTITADDGKGSVSTTFMLNVDNVAPTVGNINVSANLVPMGTAVTANAAFIDPSPNDTHTAEWIWDDGTTAAGVVDSALRTASGSHTFNTPGIYTITLNVTDDDSGIGTKDYQYIVVYDPSAGFVTGGGWFDSPEGAYFADPSLTGKASFGFVSKYQKGANIPTGSTEFQFQVANLNFHSTSYDWLVVAGSKAQFKGVGTINGQGNYGFMLTAVDGTPDRFRIKIWDKATDSIIYDNQLGVIDSADLTTIITNGSIVIHKAK